MAELYYQGHGSFRLTAQDRTVIYVDPYAGDGYEKPADLILVTHQHGDHNQVELPARKEGCRIIDEKDALAGGYGDFRVGDVEVQAVEAYNKNHRKEECVGYVIRLDGISLYAAGDTSLTTDMREKLPGMKLDFALYPTDGIYNMGPEEAGRCAAMVGARHSIPIHTKPGALFDREQAERFRTAGRIILEAGESLSLE